MSSRSGSFGWGNDVSVVGPDGKVTDYEPPPGGGCVQVSPTSCVPADRCGPGVPADVILDEGGNVIDVVCYPTKLTLTPEQITAQQGNVAQNQNGAVIVLDDVPDGVDLDGNLSMDANKVILYGAGPDVSVISGDVTVDGNNTIVRGAARLLGFTSWTSKATRPGKGPPSSSSGSKTSVGRWWSRRGARTTTSSP